MPACLAGNEKRRRHIVSGFRQPRRRSSLHKTRVGWCLKVHVAKPLMPAVCHMQCKILCAKLGVKEKATAHDLKEITRHVD